VNTLKKIKKIIVCIMTLLLLLTSLSACKVESTTESSDSASKSASTQKDADTEIENFNATGFPIVNKPITIVVAGPRNPLTKTWEGMNLFEHFTKLTGIHFEFEDHASDVWQEKKALYFASGDLPDLIAGGSFSASELLDYGSQGQLIALNDLIEKYGPNIKTAFSEVPDAKAMSTSSDGNIYGLPLINQMPRDMHVRYWISKPWLAQVGMEVPTTLDEFYQVLVAFKEEDANANGDPDDEIPVSGYSGGTVDGLILNALGVNVRGGSGGFAITATFDGTVYCMNTSEAYKEYLKFMHKLYKEKLLDNDLFVQTLEQFNAKGHENKLGVFTSAASYMTCGNDIGWEYTQFDALTSHMNSRKMVSASTGVSIGQAVITSANKYPEATLRLLDYCFSEEGSRVCRNGEEGVGWGWVDKEAGTWENYTPEGYANSQEWRAQVTMGIASWYRVDYQLGQVSYNAQWLNEMTDKYSYPYFVMQFPSLNLTEEDVEITTPIINDVTTYVAESRARFITGEDDIEQKWDDYVNNIEKMNIKTVVEIYQRYYDQYLKAMK